MQSSKEAVLAVSTSAVELSDKPARIELASGETNQNKNLGQMLQSLPASSKVYLVLTGLRAAKPPGTLFHLYLDLPEQATPKPDNAWHVGSINFYNAVPVPDAPKDQSPSPVSIDITDMIRKLRSRKKLTSVTTITIKATRPLEPGAQPMIGHIAMVTDAAGPEPKPYH